MWEVLKSVFEHVRQVVSVGVQKLADELRVFVDEALHGDCP